MEFIDSWIKLAGMNNLVPRAPSTPGDFSKMVTAPTPKYSRPQGFGASTSPGMAAPKAAQPPSAV